MVEKVFCNLIFVFDQHSIIQKKKKMLYVLVHMWNTFQVACASAYKCCSKYKTVSHFKSILLI